MPGGSPITVRLQDLTVDVSLSGVARGDLLYRGASKWQNLAAGTSGHYLKSNGAGADPSWASVSVSPGGSDGQVQYNNAGSFGGAALVTYATSGTILTAAAGATTDKVLVLKGAGSQSGNLLEGQNSAGGIKTIIDANGNLTVGATSALGTGTQGLGVYYTGGRYMSLQAGTLGSAFNFDNGGYFGVYASSSTSDDGSSSTMAIKVFGSTRNVLIGGALSYATVDPSIQAVVYTNSASKTAFAVAGTTSQTATLIQLQGRSSTTAGTAQAEIDTAWVDSTHATRKARLLLRVYDTAVREGLRIDADGTYALTAIGGGTVTASASLTVTSPTATYIPVIVKGASAQSANLQEWQNSSGTVLTSVASDGRILAPDGSATTPSFSFGSSTGTGWYLGASNRPSLAQSGVKVYEYTGTHSFIGTISAGAYLTSSVSFVALNSPQTGMCFTGRSGSTQASCDIWLIPGVPTATSAGSSTRITGSAGSGTNQNGGNVYIFGGAKTGSGLDGDSVVGYSGSAAVGNLSLFGAGSFGSGVNVVFIANATTVPSTDPTGGGILYCEGGALKYRGSSGTVTTLGAA